nr:immunoglobulin heavy chain junction region [Macaca mulatta]MOX92223.1 immunoglobulin heavy chain junction region [Macaca mulatta]MOX93533.1 immunoglobulin heavy chain junction region [Macaca mulatta]MOX93546.1 immunoglobulin heavy chain junction region [Macaca mulatta]MOX94890.1 immunoglobulin heavy chain junction region [Macaca mulatta]
CARDGNANYFLSYFDYW